MDLLLPSFMIIAVLALFVIGIGVMVSRFYQKVDQGKAMIVNRTNGVVDVTFTGGLVLPIIHRSEVMDISVKTIVISRRGKDGLICADNIRADINVSFFVRVNKEVKDVLHVAQTIGCARASDRDTLDDLFVAKFSEALKTVGKRLQFVELYSQRDVFKDQIMQVIGQDLNGYVLDDAAIDYLEQTSLSDLDKNNILDSEGIRKITQITAEQNLLTNQLRQKEKMEQTRQNLEAEEAILELQRRRADAEAKQHREVATVVAREAAETAKIQAEERQRSELARIKSEEEIAVSELNRQRQLEVAEKDKERVVAIKAEQVHRDRDVEIISREREVERQRIDKEMELEVKRKEIAEVVRGRIVVDKNVAEEEERIADLRANAKANREKSVQVIAAQGDAEESLVKEIKAAEAAEKVAEFQSRQRLVVANADLEAAQRTASAKVRLAEGVQAEVAAEGLAKVRVKEADAVANEKQGMVAAKLIEEQGLAALRVREKEIELEAHNLQARALAVAEGRRADAAALKEIGEAEAAQVRLRLLAEAEGKAADAEATKARLLADVAAHEAEARVVEVRGLAEATAIREKMKAEAEGLAKKLAAMQAMEGAAREHEEFRARLAQERELGLASLEAQQHIAEARAKVLGEAFSHADIKIMGGDGQFLDKLVQASSLGQAFDGFVGHSQTAGSLLAPYLSGERSLLADAGSAVGGGTGGEALKTAALVSLLSQLLQRASSDTERSTLEELLNKARSLDAGR